MCPSFSSKALGTSPFSQVLGTMTDKFIEPTREGRRNLLILLTLGILSGAFLQFWLKPAFHAYLNSLPACDQIKLLRVLLLSAICTPPLIAAWSIPHSIRLIQFNQFPLPGTWVMRRTPTRRGAIVRLRAYCLLLLSGIALTVPFVGWRLLEPTHIFAPTKSCT